VGDDGTIAAASYGHAYVVGTAPGGKHATVDVFVQGEIVIPSSRSGRFQLYSAERSNLTQWRKVGNDTLSATDPAFAPDGSLIAFTVSRSIYVMDADGANATRITNSTGTDEHAVFTADGNGIVFQSDRSGHSQIWLQPFGGGEAVQLTREPAANMQPAVSPDGETIAFVSTRDGTTNVWLMGKDGSNQRPCTRSTSTFKSLEPRFLRDGSLFYLVQGKEGGRMVTQIMRVDLASGKVTPVTGTDLVISDFSVSPSGDLLALAVSVQSGNKPFSKVYLQPLLTSGGPVPLPSTGAEQMLTPAFMP
jgi:Tol biopolymer transport system component